jgi:hypothetical protein
MTTESVNALLEELLLDVNFLIACGWESHVEHVRASRWLSPLPDRRSDDSAS